MNEIETDVFHDFYDSKAKCFWNECKNDEVKSIVFWKPVVKVFAKGYAKSKKYKPAELYPDFYFCDTCKKKMTSEKFLENVLNDRSIEILKQAFMSIGKAEPDFDSMILEWKKK